MDAIMMSESERGKQEAKCVGRQTKSSHIPVVEIMKVINVHILLRLENALC